MKNWFNKNYKTIIILSFLIPIITVAIVSISHVTKWYGISNPVTWAIYLSIGIEIAALSALAAISAKMGKKVYFPFGIVTLIQFIGNIYFAYSFIDVKSQEFISWVELTSPLVEFMGVDVNDYVGHKRFLAFFAGGMLPIISLSFLHMLVKFTQENKTDIEESTPNTETPTIEAKDIIGEVSRVRLNDEELDKLEKILNTKQTSESTSEDNQSDNDLEKKNFDLVENPTIEPQIDQIVEDTPILSPEFVVESIPDPTPDATVTPTPDTTPTPTPTPSLEIQYVEIPTPTPTPTSSPTPEPTITPTPTPTPSSEPEPTITPTSTNTPTPTPTIEETPIIETSSQENDEEKKNY